jgi:hypothetical protein
LLAAAGEH